jgi:hypothetical protein
MAKISIVMEVEGSETTKLKKSADGIKRGIEFAAKHAGLNVKSVQVNVE